MRQEQRIKIETTLAMRIWQVISKPFQITKVLELLYMLDWIWYAILSFLPDRYVEGSVFKLLRGIFEGYQVSVFMTLIAASHVLALFNNIIWLRKINLLFNITLLLYLTAVAFQNLPVAAGLGYLVILIGISAFAFWRMDETAE